MAQLIPLPLTISCSSKYRLVLPFWHQLTCIVPDRGPLNECSVVAVVLVKILAGELSQVGHKTLNSISQRCMWCSVVQCNDCGVGNDSWACRLQPETWFGEPAQWRATPAVPHVQQQHVGNWRADWDVDPPRRYRRQRTPLQPGLCQSLLMLIIIKWQFVTCRNTAKAVTRVCMPFVMEC